MPPLPPAAKAAVDFCDRPPEMWKKVLVLSRLVVSPEAPHNAASFLLSHSAAMVDTERWPILLTFADTAQGHTGAIYKACNWTYAGLTEGSETWVSPTGEQRGRKRGPKNIPVEDMIAAGYTRIKSQKHRFILDRTGKKQKPFAGQQLKMF